MRRVKRLLIYDLDGTLVDTSRDLTQSANHLRSQFGLPPLATAAVVQLVGRGMDRLVAGCLNTDEPDAIARGIDIYRAHYAQHLLDHSRLYPSAETLLQRFHDRIQSVITNKPEGLSCAILTGLGIADYFADIIGGDSGYPKKPDPASLQAVLAKHRVPPQEAVFIGDSDVDVRTGRQIGVETVLVDHGFADEEQRRASQADVRVKNFDELLKLANTRW